jgi:uncharacterized repeat protein (TIGR01451 family)
VTVATTSVRARADLSVRTTAARAGPGGTFSYAVVVRNAGPSAASAVTVADALPAGVTARAARPAERCRGLGEAVTCTLGRLLPGASARVVLDVAASPGARYENSATAASATPDPALGDNTAMAATGVPPAPPVADLSIARRPRPGGYALSLRNDGPAAAPDVRITGSLPQGSAIDPAAGRDGACRIDQRVLRCHVATLAAGASLRIGVRLPDRRSTGSEAPATVASGAVDPRLGDNVTRKSSGAP